MKLGERLLNQPESPEGFFRIGQRVPRTGNAQHRQILQAGGIIRRPRQCFLRGEDPAGYTGPAFVGAVKPRVTVMAGNITFRSHRSMHTGIMMMGFFLITGMIGNQSSLHRNLLFKSIRKIHSKP
ncbi:hypothetical protein D3C75_765900 [compost metagenome]